MKRIKVFLLRTASVLFCTASLCMSIAFAADGTENPDTMYTTAPTEDFAGFIKGEYDSEDPPARPPETTDAPIDPQVGDFNGDGNINAIDAYEILALSARISTGYSPGDTEQLYADYNDDGLVNALDAAKILQDAAAAAVGGTVS